MFFVGAPDGSQFPLQLWASNQGRANISLATNAPGPLQLRRDTTVLWTNTDVEPAGTWLHYELKAVLDHTTNGALTLRRNGQILVALTGIQTKIAAAAGPLDRYGFKDLPGSVATVSGVRVSYRVRKQDAVPAETRCFVQSGATVAQGANDAPDVTYRYFSALFPTHPATGAAWTPATVNALSAGVERIL